MLREYDLLGPIDEVNSLMRQAQALAYDIARIEQQFQQLFPTYSGNITQAQLLADGRARWQASVDRFKHTMEVQSRIVSDIQSDEVTLAALVDRSRGAAGASQGIQSTINCSHCNPGNSAARRLCSLRMRGRPKRCVAPKSRKRRASNGCGSGGIGVSYTTAPVQVFGGTTP
jgi:hypothetical protein